MKDKLLTYAIGISVLVHLAGVCVVARTSASRLNAAPEKPQQERLVKVDLVQDPDEATRPKPVVSKIVHTPRPEPRVNEPKPVRPEPSTYMPEPPRRTPEHSSRPNQKTESSVRPSGNRSQPAGNPGGPLNIGSKSGNGDIGGFGSGKTNVGSVPGSDRGKGQGSGKDPGVSTPDPPKHVDPGPGERPMPKQDPPAPKMVSVRVCNESGMLPGKHCDRTHSESFVDGREPSRTCDRCKAPEPPKPEPVHVSRLADRSKPELIGSDPVRKVTVPASVPEDKSVTVVVGFTCTKDGNVTDAHVTKSSGYRELDKRVVDAVSKRKYKPAVQNGDPRSVPMSATCTFN